MVPMVEEGVPKLSLPVKVTVISHPKEKKSKSSIIPAKIISPDDVDIIHTVDEIPTLRPEGESFDSTVVLFPAENATDVT